MYICAIDIKTEFTHRKSADTARISFKAGFSKSTAEELGGGYFLFLRRTNIGMQNCEYCENLCINSVYFHHSHQYDLLSPG